MKSGLGWYSQIFLRKSYDHNWVGVSEVQKAILRFTDQSYDKSP